MIVGKTSATMSQAVLAGPGFVVCDIFSFRTCRTGFSRKGAKAQSKVGVSDLVFRHDHQFTFSILHFSIYISFY